jgi:hypothetical protein
MTEDEPGQGIAGAGEAVHESFRPQTFFDRATGWPGQDGLTAALHASACPAQEHRMSAARAGG